MRTIPSLGKAGTQISVAPGMMRNHLFPKKMARYVIRGRVLGFDGKLSVNKDPPSAVSASDTAIQAQSIRQQDLEKLHDQQRRLQEDEGRIIEQQQRLEEERKRIVEQLSHLKPIVFKRRTTERSLLHGSVTPQDVLAALQKRGIQLQQIEGSFSSSKDIDEGIENGRIKRTGEYVCECSGLYH